MKLFVGLGNPGAKYAQNRHNIGFMALDRIAEDHGFAPWRTKFQGGLSQGQLGGEKVVLLKPETFMNLSGQSVSAAMRFFKLSPADVTVFHDELDLAPGRLKLKRGGGHAGHNGLRSIHQHIGDTYDRVRLGIGHPGHKDRVSGYVLSDFARADAGWLDDLLRGIADGAEHLARGDGAKFTNAVALRSGAATPAKPKRGGPEERAKAGANEGPKGQAKGQTKAQAKERADPAQVQPAEPTPKAPAPRPEDAPRSPLQKLMEKFR